MSTASPNATALPDRRFFLSTFTAAGALGLATGPALAHQIDAGHPDAALIELDALLTEARAHDDALDARCDEAYEGFEPPEMPDALFWRRSDFPSVWVDPMRLDGIGREGSERYTYACDRVLDTLRVKLAKWKALPPLDRNCSDTDVARVEEIIAGIETWQVEEARQLEVCGYTAAAEASAAQTAVVDGLLERIAMTPALTSEGVSIKVRAATRGDLQWQFARILATPDRLWDQAKELLLVSAMIDADKLSLAPPDMRSAA